MGKQPVQVATIVLAGGQGTRLYPLTIHHSKPAVSYGGRYRLIDIPLSNSINSNFRQIFVIAQYLAGELQHHVNQAYHFDTFNPGCIDVLTPQENEHGEKEWFCGTADAVRKNLSIIMQSSASHFLILSGDQLYNINFQKMVRFAQEQDADLTIAALPVREKEAKRMGLLKVDAHFQITNFCEKPKEQELLAPFRLPENFCKECKKEPHYLGSMGIYVFKREALLSLLQQDEREDFGYHLIHTAIQAKKSSAYIYKGYWEDIGTVASYYEANLVLTRNARGLNTYDEKNPIYTYPTFLPGPRIKNAKIAESIICEGSVIEAAEISESVIGLRSHVKRGSVIRNSVVMGNHFYMPPTHQKAPLEHDFWIGENCLIQKAIIDEHVRIGNGVKLLNIEGKTHYDGDGIFIRDGVTIVTAGTHLPDGFEL